ncbi:hypothetical protein EXIGLDRAFT_600069 [Exidia glandulosa HHB12029]|uniref:CID domain-containing protein n=1 Tax=Exidia glandulosa HHB12029 TaxID=1314781 RepID=A0A165QUA6_EXIGL|nr:hypothetical protein EXIGLDRAFT_600069 [Exidia glandulosa HHB12029]
MSVYPSYANPNPGYPPNPGYAHGSGFHGPPHRGPPAPPHGPPAPNPLHLDPNAFRQFYASQLATLTFNSRPIIQNLSMMAQDFQRWASIVAQCLDAHIRRVPAPIKLPAFYLLDSICKNIYSPYASVFAPMVANLFLDAYYAVDPSTQSKMEEMLVTWRTGAPDGRELFGVSPQITLERRVWGGGPPQAPQQATRKQVLAELEVTLAQKERILQSNPYDSTVAQQVDTLLQLRNLVQHSDVPPQDLAAIADQLRVLAASVPPPAPPHIPPPISTSVPPQYPSSSTMPYATPAPPPMMGPTSAYPPSVAGSVPPVGGPDLMQLYDSLLKAGVLGQSSSAPEVTPPPQVDPALEAERRYEELVMGMDVASSSSDISRKRPAIASLLYKRLPSQCKQCALRFSGEEAGKKALQDHLDMHFKQNLRASQNSGRGHSRSWFVSLEDWTQEGVLDESARKAASEAHAERDSKLRAAYVVVPPGEEAKSVQCPVCKEFLKSEFNEDDEEWVWRNAVRVQDKIYHSTCHADAIFANPLVARLKSDATLVARSRSRTPESAATSTNSQLPSTARTSLSPEPSRGVKRKAEDDDADVKQEQDTPPMKRLALSA